MTIYCLTNSITGKSYVGQTTGSVKQRWYAHKCRAGKETRGFALSAAMKKYGSDSFTLKVLQQCHSQEELDAAEVTWIEKLNTIAPSGYNIRQGGGRGRHHADAREKLRRRVFTPEWRSNLSKAMRGKKRTAEQRRAMSAQRTGRKVSEDVRLRVYVGENNGRAKLTWENVAEIRRLYKEERLSQQAIADRFGVNQTMVGFIVRRLRWTLPIADMHDR